jgi:hypothetical protein
MFDLKKNFLNLEKTFDLNDLAQLIDSGSYQIKNTDEKKFKDTFYLEGSFKLIGAENSNYFSKLKKTLDEELNKSKKMSNLYLFFSFKSYAASNHVDHEDVNIIGLYGKTMYIIDNKNLIVEKGDLLSIKKGTMHRSIALGPRIILSHGVYS